MTGSATPVLGMCIGEWDGVEQDDGYRLRLYEVGRWPRPAIVVIVKNRRAS